MKKIINKETVNEYLTITDNDDDNMVEIKTRIKSWTPSAQLIWITYCELGSYAATAREFNVSAPTAKTYVNKLKQRLVDICM